MVNEGLSKGKTDAYASGDYKKSLKLSRKLDKQILADYPNRNKSDKTTK